MRGLLPERIRSWLLQLLLLDHAYRKESGGDASFAMHDGAYLLETLEPNPDARDHDHHHIADARPSPKATRHSTAHLDGLRGLAALLVFFQHYFVGFAMFGLNNMGYGQDGDLYLFCTLPFVRLLYTGGHAAVTIFFVISGYVLSVGPLQKMRRGDGDIDGRKKIQRALAGAVVRRPFRLYLPAIAMTLIVALLLHVPGPLILAYDGVNTRITLMEELWKWADLVRRHFDPFGYHDNDGLLLPYDVVTWTLPIELKGSMWIYGVMAAASLVLTAETDTAIWFSSTLALLALCMLQLGYKWSGVTFTFGIVLAMVDVWSLDTLGVLRIFSRRARATVHNVCFVLGLYLLCQPTASREGAENTPGWGMLTRMVPEVYGDKHYYRYWSCWGSLLVVYSVLRLKYLQDFFTTRPLRYLGKVSFMLYLVHIPWMRIFSDRWHSALGGMDTFAGRQRLDWSDNLLWIPDIGPLGLNTRWFASLAATVPTTLFFADLATRYIDRPSVIAGERMAALVGLGREKSAAQQAALSDEDAAWRSRGGFLRRYIPFFRR